MSVIDPDQEISGSGHTRLAFPEPSASARSRRDFMATAAVTAAACLNSGRSSVAAAALQKSADAQSPPIVDTHQHLWDLKQFRLPWLNGAPEILSHNYGLKEYAAATEGLNVAQAVYMEVDVHPEEQVREAEALIAICKGGQAPTVAAVISGRPGHQGFAAYIKAYRDVSQIKGVRQVLHNPSAPRGLCLEPQFVASIRLLGELGKSFDFCMRPGELSDAVTLAKQCPQTRFILDHCGNASPAAFLPASVRKDAPTHDPEQWRKDIAALANCDNVICKISGVIASAPQGISPAESLAPIINHCLDEFGPDRVVFGGDWPVCLLGGTFREWVTALRTIISQRPQADQEKLWSGNARRHYSLT